MKRVFYTFGVILLTASVGFGNLILESDASERSSEKIRALKRDEYQVTDDRKIRVGDKLYSIPRGYKEDSTLVLYKGKLEIMPKVSIPKTPNLPRPMTPEELEKMKREDKRLTDKEREIIARLKAPKLPRPMTPEELEKMRKGKGQIVIPLPKPILPGDRYARIDTPKLPKYIFKGVNRQKNLSTNTRALRSPKIEVYDPR